MYQLVYNVRMSVRTLLYRLCVILLLWMRVFNIEVKWSTWTVDACWLVGVVVGGPSSWNVQFRKLALHVDAHARAINCARSLLRIECGA